MKGSAPPPGWPAAPLKPVLAHADVTRSAHFHAMLHDGTVWKLAAGAVGAAVVFGVVEMDRGAAIFGLAISPLLVLLAMVAMADRRAATDFFTAYSAARGFSHAEEGELMPFTPLLGAGERRSARHVMTGALPGSRRRATLALYTYETRRAISDGDGRDDDYQPHHLTVCVLDVPEAFPRFDGVYLGPRRDRLGDHDWLAGRGHGEVELESVEFNGAYRLRISDRQDPGIVRELFSPALVVRLIEDPLRPGLELGAGGLCVFVDRRLEDAAGLDAFQARARELLEHVEREIAERALIRG